MWRVMVSHITYRQGAGWPNVTEMRHVFSAAQMRVVALRGGRALGGSGGEGYCVHCCSTERAVGKKPQERKAPVPLFFPLFL